MSDWSHGYDVSVGYSYGFYREMAPDWLDFCAWIGGFEPPQRTDGRFRYIELGSGQGFGLCLLAAANPEADFIGIDFQADHIEHSVDLAKSAGLSNVRFVQADFLDLARQWPEDFGTFDYVTLHGVLSYLTAELREAVVRCLAHAVAPGGLVYASYNAQPGCLSTIPLQHFARRIKESTGRQGSAAVEDTIATMDRLSGANAPVFNALPALKSRLAELKTRDQSYLVHEYLSETWTIFWHSDLAREFREAGLDFVASATLADNLVREFLPAPLYDLISEQEEEGVRQDLEAFILNQAFRRDVFCRGAKPRPNSDAAHWRMRLAASLDPSFSLNFETCFGRISWDPAVFAAIVGSVADGPKSLDQLFALPNSTNWKPRHILLLLLHATVLAPEARRTGDAIAAERFNAVVARAVCEGAPYRQIAAANLGSGINADASDLLMLDAWIQAGGKADAATLAGEFVARAEKLPGTSTEDAPQRAAAFVERTLPLWRQLGAVQ